MPRAAYIIFANSGSVDQYSNSVSMFDVVESYDVSRRSNNPEAAQATYFSKPHRIVAAWLREEGDGPTDLFEGQIACIARDGSEIFIGNCDDFAFTKSVFRWNSELVIPGFTQLGMHVIEARLRRLGEQDWTERQAFSFLVQAQEMPEYEVSSPEVTQTFSKGVPISSADEKAVPENSHDIDTIGAWLFQENPQLRKAVRILIRNTFNRAFELYGDDPADSNHGTIEILGRLAHKLDRMAAEWIDDPEYIPTGDDYII